MYNITIYLIQKSYFKHRKRSAFKNPNPWLKQTNYGNGQIVLNDWTAARVTVGLPLWRGYGVVSFDPKLVGDVNEVNVLVQSV